MSREAGVELYNQKLDQYSMRQDVVDDIEMIMEHERERYPEVRRKTYEKVAHDTILWHLVSDQRPPFVETPTDARDWILTVDFRLIGFDSFKRKKGDSNFPLCLHPTSLIQMLQFWVPRTHEFEEAMLGGLRLPFLFQEFDAKAEQTSLTILSRLGRFSGSESFSEDAVIDVVLNDGLRTRIDRGQPAQEEIELIRDAYLIRVQQQVEQDKAEQERLNARILDQQTELSSLQRDKTMIAEESCSIRDELELERAKKGELDRDISDLRYRNSELKKQLEQIGGASERRKALVIYVSITTLSVFMSGAWGLLASKVLPSLYQKLGGAIAFPLSIVVAWLVFQTLAERLSKDRLQIDQLKEFKMVSCFRRRIGRATFALVLGVLGSIIGGLML